MGEVVDSFPGFLYLQFLITCSIQKRREKAWGILSCDPWPDCHMSIYFLKSQVMYETILHSVLATKLGQAPAESYTEHMKHPQAITMTPKSCWVTRREKTALFGVAPLIISAIAQQLSFEICLQVGLILWNVFQFCIFREAVDKNVNRLLHLESVMSAMPWITWCDSPGLLPFLLHTANNQKLEL